MAAGHRLRRAERKAVVSQGRRSIPADNVAGKGAPDVEPMDLNGDAFIDLITLQDGPNRRNRVLLNNGNGGYTINQDDIWPNVQNPTAFDFAGAFYDYDSDHDPDFVVGAFQTATKYPDRLMVNDGNKLSQWGDVNVPKYQALEHSPNPAVASPGTYHIALADFTGDHKLDIAMSQAENADNKLVFIATDEVAADTAVPIFVNIEKIGVIQFGEREVIRVRCHDNKSPLQLHDFTQTDGFPYVEGWPEDPGDPDLNLGDKSAPGQWYGEYLWRIEFVVPDSDIFFYRTCAIDAAGNKACTPVMNVPVEGGTETETDSDSMTMSATMTDSATMTNVSASDSMTETDSATLTDSNSNTVTAPTESASMSNTMTNSDTPASATMSDSDSTPTGDGTLPYGSTYLTYDVDSLTESTSEEPGELNDGGCICRGGVGSHVAPGLLFLFAIGRRRRCRATLSTLRGRYEMYP